MGVLAQSVSKAPALRGMPANDLAETGERLVVEVADIAEISGGKETVTGVVTASFGLSPGMIKANVGVL